MNQICIQCQEKDQQITTLSNNIKELQEKIDKLEEKIDSLIPDFKELDPHQQKQLQENIKTAMADLIGHKERQHLENFHRSQTAATLLLNEEIQQVIGQRFFEHFIILGPDLTQINQLDESIQETTVQPNILYQFPEGQSDLYEIAPIYAFPNGVKVSKRSGDKNTFNDKILPELKQIIMQTLQLNKDDNEFIFTMPREDINSTPKKIVRDFIRESNPNVFRYLVCFEINEFYYIQQTKYTCWLCPIVFCFISYYPFIKYFLKESATIWNLLKLERITPCLSDSNEGVLQCDLVFMKNKLKNAQIIDRLFDLRSVIVEYDKKYNIGDSIIKTPQKQGAQLFQFQWGCEKAFQLLTFKELIYLLSHLLLSQRIIIFSKSKADLSDVMLTAVSLIFPFNYQMPFCILLPEELIDRVGCPCPFFFGVIGEYQQYRERIDEVQQEDITFIDLNQKKVYYSQTQTRDLSLLIPGIKKNKQLRAYYFLINNSKNNAFKQKIKNTNKQQSIITKDKFNFKEIAIIIHNFWYTAIQQHIPVDKKFLKPGSRTNLNLSKISEVMTHRCPKDSRRFVKMFIQNPTFTGFLDELYEPIYQS